MFFLKRYFILHLTEKTLESSDILDISLGFKL